MAQIGCSCGIVHSYHWPLSVVYLIKQGHLVELKWFKVMVGVGKILKAVITSQISRAWDFCEKLR